MPENTDEAEAVPPFAASATFVRTPGVGVGIGVGVAVGVGVGVAVGVAVGVGVGVTVGVGVGVTVGVGVAVGVGVGVTGHAPTPTAHQVVAIVLYCALDAPKRSLAALSIAVRAPEKVVPDVI